MGSSRKKRRNEKKILIQKEKREKSRIIKKENKRKARIESIGIKNLSIKAKLKDAVEGLETTEKRDAEIIYVPNKLYQMASVWLEDGKFNGNVDVIAWNIDLHKELIAELDVDIDVDIVAD